MIEFLPGVKYKNLRLELVQHLWHIEKIFHHWAGEIYDVVITSANDGEHMEGSRHYKNCALDLRVRGLNDEQCARIAGDLQNTLGSDYDVIVGANYIHIEYDPH